MRNHVNTTRLLRVVFSLVLLLVMPSKIAAQAVTPVNNVQAITWSPNGDEFAVSAVVDGILSLWIYNDQGMLVRGTSQPLYIHALAWSPDGQKLAGIVSENTDMLYVWDAQTLAVISSIPQEYVTCTYALQWSPDSSLIAATRGRNLFIVRAADGTIYKTLEQPGETNCIQAFAWQPDGETFYIADIRGVVRIWDVNATIATTEFSNQDLVVALAFAPDGERIALGYARGSVRILDTAKHDEILTFQATPFETIDDVLYFLDWDATGEQLAVAGNRGALRIWNSTTGELLETLDTGGAGTFEGVEYSPFGGRLLIGRNTANQVIPKPTTVPNSDERLLFSQEDDGVQILVTTPSLERLQRVGEVCNTDPTLMQAINQVEPENRITQIVNATDDQISTGCSNDLIAIATVLQR